MKQNQKSIYQEVGEDITFPRPTAHNPGPRPPDPFTSLWPGTNYFFTTPNYQNYYFTALLVENISCISILSKFQTFQLKEDKMYN